MKENNMGKPQPESQVFFQDKKRSVVDYDRITSHIQEASAISKEMDVGQEEATVIVYPEYPNLPINFIWVTDVHYGNIGVDYAMLNEHFEVAESTPNTYIILGGDLVDNFSASKHPVAISGDAITPQVQAQSILTRIAELDRKSKILALGYGNHEEFMSTAGIDFWQTFTNDTSFPVFNKNGVLNLVVGRETYRIGVFHKFWGQSKINLSNRGKRAMEYAGYKNIDILLIGDDHQTSAELFDKNGEKKLVIDGGTYKIHDATGKRWGLGPAGRPGVTTFLYPDRKHFTVEAMPKTAKQMIEGLVCLEEYKKI